MQTIINVHDFKSRVMKIYKESAAKPPTNEYEAWLRSIKATLGAIEERPWEVSIYKVPERLNEDAYTPRIASIGPFHQHKQQLLQEHKWRYMLNFFLRATATDTNSSSDPADIALNKCADFIVKREKDARAYYAENVDLDKTFQLAELLLVDGCFILELFIRHAEVQQMPPEERENIEDPIISNSWMVPTLEHDLALLENQIPFFVLEELFNTVTKNSPEFLPLVKYALLFFSSALNLSGEAFGDVLASLKGCTYRHITDMLYQVYKGKNIPRKVPLEYLSYQSKEYWGFKRCATQIFKSGIQFQCSNNFSKEQIRFIDGVLTLPKVVISESSDTVIRNLIAYEQNSIDKHVVTSYVLLMRSLISSPRDARLLKEAGIIIIKSEDTGKPDRLEEKALAFFKGLCKEVVIMNFEHDTVCKAVEKYQSRPWELHRVTGYWRIKLGDWKESFGDLKHDYFKNRWSFIATLAAFFVIILTALQTFYTVRAYYPPYH